MDLPQYLQGFSFRFVQPEQERTLAARAVAALARLRLPLDSWNTRLPFDRADTRRKLRRTAPRIGGPAAGPARPREPRRHPSRRGRSVRGIWPARRRCAPGGNRGQCRQAVHRRARTRRAARRRGRAESRRIPAAVRRDGQRRAALHRTRFFSMPRAAGRADDRRLLCERAILTSRLPSDWPSASRTWPKTPTCWSITVTASGRDRSRSISWRPVATNTACWRTLARPKSVHSLVR